MAALAEKVDVDDERLLGQRLARGDADAFDEVLQRFAPDVQRLAQRLLGWRGREGADDVVQEVMIRVFLQRRAFRGQSSLRTWLMRITINQCRSLQRRRIFSLETLWHVLRRPTADPREVLARDELQTQVRSAVGNLARRDREVIVLHYLEELPVAEVARIVGSTAGAVMVRLHRARQRLGEQLAHMEGPGHG